MKIKSNNKRPFNVFRKPVTAAILGVTMLVGSVGMLTGCSGEKGENGASGKSAYELAVENGFTGSVQDWLESLKGNPGENGSNGVGVKDVTVEYEYDTAGSMFSVVTIYYTDGSINTIRSEIPKKVKTINGFDNTTFFTFPKNKMPILYVNVTFEDGSVGKTRVTQYMISGSVDFSTPGTKLVTVTCHGKTYTGTINILEKDDSYVLEEPDKQYHRVGITIDDIMVKYVKSNDASYAVYSTLTVDMIESVYNFSTGRDVAISEIDFTRPNHYSILLKDQQTINIETYDPTTQNIKEAELISVNEGGADIITPVFYKASVGDEDFIKDNFVGNKLRVEYFEPIHGKTYADVIVTEDMINTSNLDINVVGLQRITIEYALEDQETFSLTKFIYVETDLSEATLIDTYSIDPSLLEEDETASVSLYSNGIATFNYSGVVTQSRFDLEWYENDVLKYESLASMSSMKTYSSYYKINHSTKMLTSYKPETPIQKVYNYKAASATINVYGTTGVCIATCTHTEDPTNIIMTLDVKFNGDGTLSIIDWDLVIGVDLIDITPTTK